MKKTSIQKIISSYIFYNLKWIFLFCIFVVIFTIVIFLYNLPTEPVLYTVSLWFYIGITFLSIDFFLFYRRHKTLQHLLDSITVNVEDIPESKNLLEQDYQKLLQTLFEEKNRIGFKANKQQTDMNDYITLWAHQIKTPIAAVQLLLQTEQNQNSSELLSELFKIEQYVEMVLQYMRLESMNSDLVLKQSRLDDIVRQAIRKYARMFIRKKIKLNYSEIDCTVLTDEKWLVFVIEQLLSNAIKYTKSGTILIYMDKSEPNTLVIEDTGIGIASEDLPRVFERGYTGYNGRSDKKSTGIGLFLCKEILTKLSHTISIESQVDKGTKVKINLETLNISQD